MSKRTKHIFKTWYIYGHFTKDTNELFYIGVGTGDRKNSSWGRNFYWQRIVEKHGYEVHVIIGGFSDRNEALAEEVRLQLINSPRACIQYGDTCKRIVSEETLLRMSIALKGKKRSPEAIKNMSEGKKGIPSKKRGVRCTKQTRDKMRVSAIEKQKKRCQETTIGIRSANRNFIEINRLRVTLERNIGAEKSNEHLKDFYESCSSQFQKNKYQVFSGQFKHENDEEFLSIYDQLFDEQGKLRTGISHNAINRLCKLCNIGNICK